MGIFLSKLQFKHVFLPPGKSQYMDIRSNQLSTISHLQSTQWCGECQQPSAAFIAGLYVILKRMSIVSPSPHDVTTPPPYCGVAVSTRWDTQSAIKDVFLVVLTQDPHWLLMYRNDGYYRLEMRALGSEGGNNQDNTAGGLMPDGSISQKIVTKGGDQSTSKIEGEQTTWRFMSVIGQAKCGEGLVTCRFGRRPPKP